MAEHGLPTVAVLAGGLATRLYPVTLAIPKSLVEVAHKPFVFHQLELLRSSGLHSIVMCVGHLGEMIRDAVGNGSAFGMQIEYSFDGPKPLGTGGALKKALPLLDNEFFVLYGDSYLECDYQDIYRAFSQSQQPALMTIYHNKNRLDVSNVVFRDRMIERYDKRNPSPEMEYVDYGLGIFKKAVFETISDDEPTDLANIYHALANQRQLAGYVAAQRFYEIGSPQGLLETREYLSSKTGVQDTRE